MMARVVFWCLVLCYLVTLPAARMYTPGDTIHYTCSFGTLEKKNADFQDELFNLEGYFETQYSSSQEKNKQTGKGEV